MINQFDSEDYPEGIPDRLSAGYQWAWTNPDITEAYPTTLYTLRYDFLELATGTVRPFTSDKVSSAHVIQLTIAETAITAGEYRWQAVVVRDSDLEEVLVDEGLVDVVEKSGTSSSHVYRVLAAIRATIEGMATKEQQSYSIAGRSLSRYSPEDLMKLENEYSVRWESEKAGIDKRNNRTANNTVKVKMSA